MDLEILPMKNMKISVTKKKLLLIKMSSPNKRKHKLKTSISKNDESYDVQNKPKNHKHHHHYKPLNDNKCNTSIGSDIQFHYNTTFD